jgi:DNA-binding LacI/PurR family transcriptional regulator
VELFGKPLNPAGPAPLREQIKAILEAEIGAGRWTSGERLPTVRQLAQISGCSSTPISQALSALVSEGYLIQHVGRGTFLRSADPQRRQRSHIAGIVYSGAAPGKKSTASEAFDRELLLAVAGLLTSRGYAIQVFHEDTLPAEGCDPRQVLAQSPFAHLDGVLNIGPVGDAVLSLTQILNLPCLCLGDPHPPPDVPFVAGGIQQAVWEALDILYRAGHRDIGLLHTVTGLPKRTRRLRYEAFHGACAELGIHPRSAWIVDGGPRYNVDLPRVRELLTNPVRPSAIVCTHNHVAQAAYEVASLTGLRIPQDLSVLLITSQADFGEDFAPPLSTLLIPIQPYAETAVDLLVDLIQAGRTKSNRGGLIRPVRRLRDSICRFPPERSGIVLDGGSQDLSVVEELKS